MSGFLFDTNIPSEMMRKHPDPTVMGWLRRQANHTIFISSISLGELRRGVTLLVKSDVRRVELEQMIREIIPLWFDGRILPVDRAIAERWGELDGRRQLAGKPLNTGDGLIAATALEHGLTVVTRNVRDFSGLGVQVFNPWEFQG